MRTIHVILMCGMSLLFVSCQSSTAVNDKQLTVRTTAYTHSEADHVKYGRKTAIGTQLKSHVQYTSAASDWSFLPVGTVFSIKGTPHKYIVDDYGSALVGTKTIDIYCPSRRAMNKWGVKFVDISIECMGDYRKSLLVLQDRCKYPHVRRMYNEIKHKI